jgi:hypothetical protein
MDATHALDSIAGGNEDDDLRMGDSKANRSIGSQWKTRVQALKNAVKNAKAAGKGKMDVKLQPCEADLS